VAEIHDAAKTEEYLEKYPRLRETLMVVGSDAHYLWDIRDKEHYFELEDEPYSSDYIRKQLFRKLGGIVN